MCFETFSPLTPALSPLRGEGEEALDIQRSPSPLNGERAGVRGEDGTKS